MQSPHGSTRSRQLKAYGALLQLYVIVVAAAGCQQDRIEAPFLGDQLERNLKQLVTDGEKMRASHPNDHRNLWRLGLAYERLGAWDKAAPTFADAATLAPTFADYFEHWGRSLVELGLSGQTHKFDEAKAPLYSCTQKDPHLATCFYYLGVAHEWTDRPEQALKLFSHAIKLDPTAAEFYLPPARLYFAFKRFEEARTLLQTAIHFTPKTARTHNDLVENYLLLSDVESALGNVRAAIAALEHASVIAGDTNPEIHYRLGRTYAKLTPPRRKQAIEQLRSFIKKGCRPGQKRWTPQCRDSKALLFELGRPKLVNP